MTNHGDSERPECTCGLTACVCRYVQPQNTVTCGICGSMLSIPSPTPDNGIMLIQPEHKCVPITQPDPATISYGIDLTPGIYKLRQDTIDKLALLICAFRLDTRMSAEQFVDQVDLALGKAFDAGRDSK